MEATPIELDDDRYSATVRSTDFRTHQIDTAIAAYSMKAPSPAGPARSTTGIG